MSKGCPFNASADVQMLSLVDAVRGTQILGVPSPIFTFLISTMALIAYSPLLVYGMFFSDNLSYHRQPVKSRDR
jgi:hypothetical protein